MTTDLTRRGFLKGVLTVGAVAALPALALHGMPTLWGDGIHDDTEALQALFDGKEVIHGDNVIVRRCAGDFRLAGGTFRISKTLEINGMHGGLITNVTITSDRGFDGPIFLVKDTSSHVALDRLVMETA